MLSAVPGNISRTPSKKNFCSQTYCFKIRIIFNWTGEGLDVRLPYIPQDILFIFSADAILIKLRAFLSVMYNYTQLSHV